MIEMSWLLLNINVTFLFSSFPGRYEVGLVLTAIFFALAIMVIVPLFVYKQCKKNRSRNENNTPDVEVPMDNTVTAQPTETVS